MAEHNVYRNGRIYVHSEMCSTCIFHPGNRMFLHKGRLKDLVDTVKRKDSCIPCHKTLDGDNAICRGQFDKVPTPTLELAKRMGMIEFVDPPKD